MFVAYVTAEDCVTANAKYSGGNQKLTKTAAWYDGPVDPFESRTCWVL